MTLGALLEVLDLAAGVAAFHAGRVVNVAIVACVDGELGRIVVTVRTNIAAIVDLELLVPLRVVVDRKGVFERRVLERKCRVACGAFRTISDLVHLRRRRFRMARNTRLRGPLEDARCMARFAVDARMFPGEFKARGVVIEICEIGVPDRAFPGRRRMATRTSVSELAKMDDGFGMARDARLRSSLERIRFVARFTIRGLMFARKFEGCSIVVEARRRQSRRRAFPRCRGMATRAGDAELAFVNDGFRVTTETRL